MTDTYIGPAPIAVPGTAMEDIRRRLEHYRWPEVENWVQSAPLGRVQVPAAHWHDHYDWWRCEAVLSRWEPHHD